jgi:protein-S-isoprenylcysteine O-methyltransferase Ste14
MWAAARLPPLVAIPWLVRLLVAALLFAAGIAVASGGVASFRRTRTTVNPLKPETTTALVVTGVYSFTRNPMYLGMVLVLLAWAVFLAAPWTLAGPAIFMLYITRFQIIPEERVLAELFGESFAAYRRRVRRWL